MFLSARKLLTPTLWHLLELKEGSHETGLSGLHMAPTGYCDLGWAHSAVVARQRPSLWKCRGSLQT